MIDAAVQAAFSEEGPATFATEGPDGPHLVATWQSYLLAVDATTLAWPAAGYQITEANLKAGSPLQLVVGSRVGKSTVGFRLSGTAEVGRDHPAYALVKARFPWCRAALVLHVAAVARILG
jgi:hypothetical protein